MNLKNCREAETDYSGTASDVARKLAFAGLAMVWIFKVGVQGCPTLPAGLVWATAFIAVGLLFDLTQYVFGASYWTRKVKSKEAELVVDKGRPTEHFDEGKEFTIPFWYGRVTDLFFYGKLALVGCAYIALLWYIVTVKLFR